MKKAVSIISAIALLLTMSFSAFAAQYSLDLPTQSPWSGRCANFVSGGLYSPTTMTQGGTVTTDAEADDKISGGKGLLVMQRYLDSGELYWEEYVNSTYGCGDGYVELPITKSSENDSVTIDTRGGGYTVMVEWANDGKLYAKNRKNASDGDATSWNYICDIDGLSAKFTFYIYTDVDCYYIAVNDKIVSDGLYSMSANPSKSEKVRITYNTGSVGTVWVDYKYAGAIGNHSLIPAGVEVDAADAANGNITVNGKFLGLPVAASSNMKMFNAIYTLNGELKTISAADVASNIVASPKSETLGVVSANINIGDANYKDLYVKTLIWNNDVKPTGSKGTNYFYSTPVKTGTINETNGLRHGSTEGGDFGTIEYGDNWMTITRGVDTPEGEKQYMASTNYNNGASYSILDDGVMNFNLTKSRKDMKAYFIGLPCDYVALSWDDEGQFWACYRDSAEQNGTTATWKKLGYKTDDLTVNVTVAYNGPQSTYSLWINDVPVVADKYSRAVYAGSHNVPGRISQVRIYTEEGKAGDVFKLTNFRFYEAVGFGG